MGSEMCIRDSAASKQERKDKEMADKIAVVEQRKEAEAQKAVRMTERKRWQGFKREAALKEFEEKKQTSRRARDEATRVVELRAKKAEELQAKADAEAAEEQARVDKIRRRVERRRENVARVQAESAARLIARRKEVGDEAAAVSYTHLRAHETDS